MPTAILAGFWGLIAASALLIGAAIGYFTSVPQRMAAAIMAFGSGVLISALSFNLMDEAYRTGGFAGTAVGFIVGAGIYTAANVALARRGGRHRKRSGDQQAQERGQHGGSSGMAIAVGSLMDSIPESIVIGLTMITSGAVSLVAVVAIWLSNVPEGLSSSTGMKKAGRSPRYVFGLWSAAVVVCAVSALLGYALFAGFSSSVVAATTAFAAGAILSMLADTMIPEAFQFAHDVAGLVTVVGFLAAFVLAKVV